jgi:hypothetical protein
MPRGVDSFCHLFLNLVECPCGNRPGSCFMAAAAKVPGKGTAVSSTTTPKAELHSLIRLLNHDCGNLCSLHRKSQVDKILGISW